jgi:hypothetical protein
MRHPVNNPVFSDPFGPRFHPTDYVWRNHNGQDYGQAGPILAMGDGVMLPGQWSGGGGNLIRVDYGVIDGSHIIGVSMHAAAPSPLPAGTPVREGDAIGTIGNTGSQTTGRHLHQEIHRDGTPIDPVAFINAHPTDTSAALATVIERLENNMTAFIGHADGPAQGGVAALVVGAGVIPVSGEAGREHDGVAGKDRNVAGVVDKVWGISYLNGTDWNTAVSVNESLTQHYLARVAAAR